MLNTLFNYEGEPHMSELHVLGIGSPFGDDQLGLQVVNLLQQQPTLSGMNPQQLHLEYCDRPGMHLLELMKPAQTVFLIDAIKTGATIGKIHCFQNAEIENIADSLSTHALGVAAAMKMGNVLQLLPQKVVLYGIEIDNVQCQFTLSEPIEQAIKLLAVRIENDILSLLSR